jgi:hypothetical protein
MDSTVEAPFLLRWRASRAGRRAGKGHLPRLGHPERDSFIAWLQRTIDANAEEAVRNAYGAIDALDQRIAEIEERCGQLGPQARRPDPPETAAEPAAHRAHADAVAKADAVTQELVGLHTELARQSAARAAIDEAHRAAARSTAECLRSLSGPYWAANLRARREPDLEVPDLPQPTVPAVLLSPLPRRSVAGTSAGVGA